MFILALWVGGFVWLSFGWLFCVFLCICDEVYFGTDVICFIVGVVLVVWGCCQGVWCVLLVGLYTCLLLLISQRFVVGLMYLVLFVGLLCYATTYLRCVALWLIEDCLVIDWVVWWVLVGWTFVYLHMMFGFCYSCNTMIITITCP